MILTPLMTTDFFLVKLTPQGQLDTSFNETGIAEQPDVSLLPGEIPFTTKPDDMSLNLAYWNYAPTAIQDLIVLSNGDILAGGYTNQVGIDSTLYGYPITYNDVGFALVRYKSDGSIDATFGDNGVTFTSSQTFDAFSLPEEGGEAYLDSMEIVGDRIIAVGVASPGIYQDHTNTMVPVIAGYDLNGNLLNGGSGTTYGTGGVIVESTLVDAKSNDQPGYEEDDEGHGLEFQMERGAFAFDIYGNIVASLAATLGSWTFVRINASDGSLDSSFGADGALSIPAFDPTQGNGIGEFLSGNRPSTMLVDGDNNVIGFGILENRGNGPTNNMDIPAVIRFANAAQPDAVNLSATATANGSVSLTWTNAGFGEDGFEIERDGTVIGTVGSDQDDFVDSGAAHNTSYNYQVLPFSTGDSGDQNLEQHRMWQLCTRFQPVKPAINYRRLLTSHSMDHCHFQVYL